MERKADLHCHSMYSDGSCRPTQLIDLAIEKGFSAISITDHDSLDAFDDGIAYATERQMIFLPGVEISAKFHHEPIHSLGYSFDPHSASLFEFCRIHRERREIRNQMMLENLGRHGMAVTMKEVKELSPGTTTYGRPHIALVMMKKGYVKDIVTAFNSYLGTGRSCYVEGEKWTVKEAIDAIHAARGKAVLAHPHLIKTGTRIEGLFAFPFDGIEAYYGSMSADINNRWCEIAKKHSLFVTGGSDYHGTVKPENRFGSSWTPEATLELLHRHFLSL